MSPRQSTLYNNRMAAYLLAALAMTPFVTASLTMNPGSSFTCTGQYGAGSSTITSKATTGWGVGGDSPHDQGEAFNCACGGGDRCLWIRSDDDAHQLTFWGECYLDKTAYTCCGDTFLIEAKSVSPHEYYTCGKN